jgi:plasmid stabilization system protein ParE
VTSAAASPGRHAPAIHGTRRVLLRRFPYKLFFLAGGDELVVVMFSHAARDPEAVRQRLRRRSGMDL